MRRGRTLCSARNRDARLPAASGSSVGARDSASLGTLRPAKMELSENVRFSRTDIMLGILSRLSALWVVGVDAE